MGEIDGLSGVLLGAALIAAALAVAFVAAVGRWAWLVAALFLFGAGVYAIFALAP